MFSGSSSSFVSDMFHVQSPGRIPAKVIEWFSAFHWSFQLSVSSGLAVLYCKLGLVFFLFRLSPFSLFIFFCQRVQTIAPCSAHHVRLLLRYRFRHLVHGHPHRYTQRTISAATGRGTHCGDVLPQSCLFFFCKRFNTVQDLARLGSYNTVSMWECCKT